MIIFFVSFSSTTPTPVCSTSSLGRTTLGTFIKWTRGTVSQRLDLTTTHTVTSPFYFKTPDIQLSGQNIVVKLPFCQQLSYWRTPQCNKINGTAGQMWPPFMTKETTLPFYSPDACRWVTYACLDVWLFFLLQTLCIVSLCRSLELVYQRPGVMKGIPLYRYVAPKTMFANGTDYEPNEGFCPCRQSGLLNVSSCRQSEYSSQTAGRWFGSFSHSIL